MQGDPTLNPIVALKDINPHDEMHHTGAFNLYQVTCFHRFSITPKQ
tara:strand:- start:785 stop:922 length:138 start_codon:yes stop_codon:yes gene_type:complete